MNDDKFGMRDLDDSLDYLDPIKMMENNIGNISAI